jgi:hypothetical protein
MDGLVNPSMLGATYKPRSASMAFYYPPASGFAVMRYAILKAFTVINCNLYNAIFFGEQLTILATSSETLTRLLAFM